MKTFRPCHAPMPQVCITKVERIFQSNNPLQDAMKETWKILQSGMCVSENVT